MRMVGENRDQLQIANPIIPRCELADRKRIDRVFLSLDNATNPHKRLILRIFVVCELEFLADKTYTRHRNREGQCRLRNSATVCWSCNILLLHRCL
ncbi:hypothetical protein BC938DRAFT_475009 [Jimgerdemannia flammicorona]|uniref:Uncharacterized protein n=1 Tax=Jimgerdemannia flammicorona TaxID=994334 RepID=A0A433Q149_9FUNG|nr:hypothetical protein BC938DRAFT_475009 [Jimgerdemannia flammicorona]